MASSMIHNVEYEVLQWATDKLHNAFRSSIKTLAGRFYAEKLLTTEVQRSCSEGSDSCVEVLVSNLQDRVSNDPPAYYKILAIVESETGVSYIVKLLEEKRSEIKKEKKKAEEERERELQKWYAEHKKGTIHLQESGGHRMGLHGRPTQLPTFTTAAPTINSFQASTRNIIAPSFHHSTGPAAYNQPYPPTIPFNKQQTPSNSQAGDNFPLQATSPQYGKRSYPADSTTTSPMTTIPTQRKQSECNLESLNGRVAALQIVTGMTTGVQQLSRMTGNSMETQPQSLKTAEIEKATAGPRGCPSTTTACAQGEDNQTASKDKNGGNYLSPRRPEQEMNSDKETRLSSPSDFNNEHTSFSSEPLRRDSTSSIESESFQSFGSASGSLTSSIDSRGSTHHRQKKCNMCQFFKKELEKLEEKVSELECKNRKLTDDLSMQQHHSTQQIDSYRQELSNKEYFLTVSQHRHQEMERKMHWLQSKVAELEQTSTIQAMATEIETLKHERDRERNEKEKERLQKEKECAEKEKERVLYEHERERRLSLEKELYHVRLLLTRAKSLTCEEQDIFINVELSGTVTNEGYLHQPQLPNTVAPLPGQSDIHIDPLWTAPNTEANAGQWSSQNTTTNPPQSEQWRVPNTGVHQGAASLQSIQNSRTNITAEQWSAPNPGTNLPAEQLRVPNNGNNLGTGQWSVRSTTGYFPAEQWSDPSTGTYLAERWQSVQNNRTIFPPEQRSAPITGTQLGHVSSHPGTNLTIKPGQQGALNGGGNPATKH